MSQLPDEWPPKKARTMEAWDAYWARQRWDRRFRHDHISPFLSRWKHRLKAPRRAYHEVRWFVQRGKRGWAASDTWGMDGYLCQVLGEMAAYMNEHRHGYKCQGQVTDCWKPGVTCDCDQAWGGILDAISGPLLAYKTHWDHPDGMSVEEYMFREQEIIGAAQDALRLLAEHLPSLWD